MSNAIEICKSIGVARPNPAARLHKNIESMNDIHILLQMLQIAIDATGAPDKEGTITFYGDKLTKQEFPHAFAVYVNDIHNKVPDWTATRKVEGTIVALAQQLPDKEKKKLGVSAKLPVLTNRIKRSTEKVEAWLEAVRAFEKKSGWMKGLDITQLETLKDAVKGKVNQNIYNDLIKLVKMLKKANSATGDAQTARTMTYLGHKLSGVKEDVVGSYDIYIGIHNEKPQRTATRKVVKTIVEVVKTLPLEIQKRLDYVPSQTGFDAAAWLKNPQLIIVKLIAELRKLCSPAQAARPLLLSPGGRDALNARGSKLFEVIEPGDWQSRLMNGMQKIRLSAAATLKVGGISATADLKKIGEDDGGETGSLHLNPSLAAALDIPTAKHAIQLNASFDYERKGFQNREDINIGILAGRKDSRIAGTFAIGGKFFQNENATRANPDGGAFYLNGMANLKLSDRFLLESGLDFETARYNGLDYNRLAPYLGPRINLGNYASLLAAARYTFENREYQTTLLGENIWSKNNHRIGGIAEFLFDKPSYALRVFGHGSASLSDNFTTEAGLDTEFVWKGKSQTIIGLKYLRSDLTGAVKDSILAKGEYLSQHLGLFGLGAYVEAGAVRVALPEKEEWGGQVMAGGMVRFGTPPSYRAFRRDLSALTDSDSINRDALLGMRKLDKVYSSLFGSAILTNDVDKVNTYAVAFKTGLLNSDYTLNVEKFKKTDPSLSLEQKIKNADRSRTTVQNSQIVQIGAVAPIEFKIGSKADSINPDQKARYEKSIRVISKAKQEILRIGLLRHQFSKEFAVKTPEQATDLAQQVIYAVALLSGYTKDNGVLESFVRGIPAFRDMSNDQMSRLISDLGRELDARVVGKNVMKFAQAKLGLAGSSHHLTLGNVDALIAGITLRQAPAAATRPVIAPAAVPKSDNKLENLLKELK